MVLKLRVRSDRNQIAWRIFDKVRKVEYEFIDEAFVIEKRNKFPGIVYVNNFKETEACVGRKSDTIKNVVEVYVTFEDGLSDIFYTDDMVYIMNDNGKTCDTINT